MSPPRRGAPRVLVRASLGLVLTAIGVAQQGSEVNAMFESGSVHVGDRDYPYRLLVPPADAGADPAKRWPLVVFLHGAGERGTDNEHQLHWLPRTMAEAKWRERLPCFLLAVQCPADQQWVEVPWGEPESRPMPSSPSQPMRAVEAALQQVLAARAVDRRRVYLTGLSMGGYGAFDLACRHPEWFAAVVPVCGGGDERLAERLVGLPAWIWHGDRDAAVPVQRSRTMAAAIAAAGGDARYSELPGVGHDSWKQAYGDDGALPWLFEQRRAPLPFADVVPWPAGVEIGDGVFALGGPGGEVAITADVSARAHADVFAGELRALCGVRCEVASAAATSSAAAAGGGSVALQVDPRRAAAGYELRVTRDGVVIAGRDVAGLAAGSSALLQMLRPADAGSGWEAPCAVLRDAPAVEHRMVLIDCARHFQSLAELRVVVDLCRLCRVDLLQLHLSDHEAFRFASASFPEIASKEHYTADELRALDDYAAARGVAIVPELDVPGHSKALTTARPDVFALKDGADRGVVCMGRAAARDGLARLFAELCSALPRAPFVHIGGDEVDTTGVAEDPDCAACMRENGLSGPDELLRWFVLQMHAEVQRLSRRTMVWEGFAPGARPAMAKDLVVVAWESGYYRPDRLVADGFDVVNASWKPLYVVGGGRLPPHAAPRRWSARQIFDWAPRRFLHFDPRMPSFAGIDVVEGPGTGRVRGAMMCVWEQEDGTAFDHLRARLPAFAERACRPDGDRGFGDFATRARAFDRRLAALVPRANAPSPHADEWAELQRGGPARVRYRLFAAPPRGFARADEFAGAAPFATGTLPILRGGPLAGPLGVELLATLVVPADGDYGLRLESCDGPARLWLDGELVCAHDRRDHWEGEEVTVALKRGDRALRVLCAQGVFATLCRVQWRPPGATAWSLVDPALRELPR